MADENKNPYDLREIFQRMELDLIASLKRNFYRHKNEELKEGFEWEQWQLSKLRNIEKFRKENRELIDKYSEPIQNAIDSVLQESFKAGENRVTKLINQIKNWLGKYIKKEAVIEFPTDIAKNTSPQGIEKLKDIVSRVINKPKNNPPSQETNFFGINDKKLKALIDSTKKDINMGRQSVLRKMDDVYRQTIYKTHVYLQSGATSLNQAIDMATKDFLDKGVNSIVYKDGKRVNIASYAEMALRTASQRATFLGEGKKRDEWGMHLVVVSAHANTCPLCLKWQGKILIDDVFSNGSKADGDYPLLSEAMEAGLLHPQCRHTLATYFPGITKLPKVPQEDVINANYKAEQRQRAIEREIRRWKRREAGALDDKNVQLASEKVKELQDKLRQHLKENPQLRRDYSREKPGPGISNKDVKVNRKTLKTNTENAKIKRDGAVRAKEFSKYWKEASLKDSINRFVPNHTVIKKLEKGKILYMSNDSNIQIVYDIKGNYFRIQDLSIKGKRSYLDLQGNNPTNKIVDGKQKGRSKEEYEPLTHFKNKDGDN